jgi:hypothetical protein
MLIGEVLRRIRGNTAARLEKLESSLTSGGAASFDDYRYRVGVIRGLHEIEDILREVMKSLNEGDEEDE